MYQKYSIGKMASLLGISAEAIRYYESKEIIRPIRDPDTGYRYYSTWDFHMLLRARYYQKCGFSLEEISALFRSRDLGKIGASLHDQEDAIQREIIYQMNLLKRVRQSQELLADAERSVGQYRLARRPGIYRINTQKNYMLYKDKTHLDLIADWVEKEPFVYSCAVFYADDIRAGTSRFDFGMGLDEEYAGEERSKTEVEDMMRRLSQLCGCSVAITGVSTSGENLGAGTFDKDTGKVAYTMAGRVHESYHGTGDVFGSSFLAAYMNGKNLEQSAQIAADFTRQGILNAIEDGQEPRYGADFERSIPWLIKAVKGEL